MHAAQSLRELMLQVKTAEIKGVSDYLSAIHDDEERSGEPRDDGTDAPHTAWWGASSNPEGLDPRGSQSEIQLGDISNKSASANAYYFRQIADNSPVSDLVKEAFVGAAVRLGGKGIAAAGRGLAAAGRGVAGAASATNNAARGSRQWMNNASAANQAGTATTAQKMPFTKTLKNPASWLNASATTPGSVVSMGTGAGFTAAPLMSR